MHMSWNNTNLTDAQIHSCALGKYEMFCKLPQSIPIVRFEWFDAIKQHLDTIIMIDGDSLPGNVFNNVCDLSTEPYEIPVLIYCNDKNKIRIPESCNMQVIEVPLITHAAEEKMKIDFTMKVFAKPTSAMCVFFTSLRFKTEVIRHVYMLSRDKSVTTFVQIFNCHFVKHIAI